VGQQRTKRMPDGLTADEKKRLNDASKRLRKGGL
jgi:hypothetical protein